MSLNTAHVNGGVLIHAGECILLYSDGVNIDFIGKSEREFKETKHGKIFLTTHRMVFLNGKSDPMQSFSFPFCTLSDVELEQPVFGANFIKGKVRAQPNGNWVGEVKFKMVFKKGGAIDFGQAMLKAAHLASRNNAASAPPPYTSPAGPWYQAPPPAYAPPAAGYYGWVPPNHAFPDQPPVNTVFMTDSPPPYPGINPNYTGYATAPQNQAFGFTQSTMSPAEGKAAEAAQSAYYDPNKPQCAYVPPPEYYEPPPAYHEANKKTQ